MTCTRGIPLLRIEHVSLAFGARVVLRDVNAEVCDLIRPGCVQGQVICFLGPSGIGKTQLSRVIAGLQAPTSGQVLIERGAQLQPVQAGDVGMVPQNYPLFEFATVRENFRIAGRQTGLTDAGVDKKAKPYVEAFELAEHLLDYPSALSGGTRQRVAIIRQLLCSGHYLVMDEPFSGLDPVMKQHAAKMITQVANLDEQNTVIVVTHDIATGCSVADTVWLMGHEAGQPGARLVEQYDLVDVDIQESAAKITQRFLTIAA